jgi:hypothetical protein
MEATTDDHVVAGHRALIILDNRYLFVGFGTATLPRGYVALVQILHA